MSLLTHIFQANLVEETESTVEGKIVTRPALIHADGINVTYSVDVDIGEEGAIDESGTIGPLYLYNVPIAAGNRTLIYAEIGSAVTLSKNGAGQWEVTGFAKTAPHLYVVTPVTVPIYCLTVPTENPPGDPVYHTPIIGEPIHYGETLRVLTYQELSTYGSYGSIPYGAIGVFVNDTFKEWRIA